jgi:tripeptidyl-peptidase-1
MLLTSAAVSALLTFAPLVVSTPAPLRDASTAYALKSFHHAPRKWARIGDAPSDHVIRLQIGLKQGRFDEILKHLDEGKIHFRLFNPQIMSRISGTI